MEKEMDPEKEKMHFCSLLCSVFCWMIIVSAILAVLSKSGII